MSSQAFGDHAMSFALGRLAVTREVDASPADTADVAAFFADYEQGNRCADVDDSTGVDPVDMAIFFQAYEVGGC